MGWKPELTQYGKTLKGKFSLKNPQKYKGNPANVIFRSNLERRFYEYFDSHKEIVAWGAEELAIPYISPIDNQIHRYYIDAIVKNQKGEIFFIEIKPKSQTCPPKPGKRKTQKFLKEEIDWVVNQAKWKAASEYAKKKGGQFLVLTEDALKIKK